MPTTDTDALAHIPAALHAPLPATGGPLALYDAVCKALAEAKAVDEVQGVRAQAEAMRAYAKQAKNRQLEVDAAEIRIRAERRLGELMAAQKETVGAAAGAREPGTRRGSTRVESQPASLAEAGIDKNLAHRARTYAAVPEEQFEELLTQKRQRESVHVALDPDFQAEAALAARDIEIERDERIALGGAGALAAENEQLKKQIGLLDRRIAALSEKNSSLEYRVKMWRARAEQAGWKGRNDG